MGDLTGGVAGGGALVCVLTVSVAAVAVADVDVIDVGVGLQREDEADQISSGQQHRNRVHQGPGGAMEL